jgi:hypothetical protein
MLITGIVIGSLGVVGGAIASRQDVEIVACAQKKTGVLRYAKNGKCRKSETRISWNQQGPQGATGAAGTSGAAGPAGPAGTPAETPALTCATGGVCEGGDTGPGGGIVFYIEETPQPWGKYLEAAPTGWYDGTTTDPSLIWCGTSPTDVLNTTVPGGALGEKIGDGWANSVNIAKHCPYGAATTARMYRGGALTDWYLPSKDEINQMYLKRIEIGILDETNRWSSTQDSVDSQRAWRKFFNAVSGDVGLKSVQLPTRPIRAFG